MSFEVKYKLDDEWVTTRAGEENTLLVHGEDDKTSDPSFVIGQGVTIPMHAIPLDAASIYVFYHLEAGEDPTEEEDDLYES